MTTPSNAPETAAEMSARAAVRNAAREQRWDAEVAPLLAAQGIDLDALKGKGLEELNEALARAAEKHKVAALTPGAAQRTAALVILRAFVEALDSKDEQRANEVLAGVAAEPQGDAPAVSHVIGTAARTLDAWFPDATLQPALAVTPVSRTGNKLARAVAGDLLGLARRGRAFASLDALRKRYSGLIILEGAALAIAAASTAVAANEAGSISAVLGRLLADDGAMQASMGAPGARTRSAPGGTSFARPGAAFGGSAVPQNRTQPGARDDIPGVSTLAQRFGVWLERQTKIAAPNVPAELEMFRSIVELADARGLSLDTPDHIAPVVGMLDEMANAEKPEVAHNALATLDDYLHSRLVGTGGEAWKSAHLAVEDALGGGKSKTGGAGAPMLGAVLAAAQETDPSARLAAITALRPVARVSELLEWIGRSKEVTDDGSLTGPDRAHVAEVLGSPGVREWWAALVYAGIVETSASRARRGPQANAWTATDVPPLELAEKLVMIFVAETLAAPLRDASDGASKARVADAISRVLEMLSVDQEEQPAQPGGPDALDALTTAGLIVSSEPHRLGVPEMLQGVVARGTLLAMEILTGEGPAVS